MKASASTPDGAGVTCNGKTPLFFRQAVGRIVRALGTPEDMEAYCFIPDHPTLVRHAQQITEAQAQAIEDESDEEFDRSIRQQQRSLFPVDLVLGTEHTGTAGTIIEGEALDPVMAATVASLAREFGISECAALKVFKKYEAAAGAATGSTAQTSEERRSPQRPLEDQLDDGRAVLDRIVKRVTFRLLRPDDPDRFKKVNTYVNRFVGKQRRQFTLEDFRRAAEHLQTLQAGDL